MLDEIVHECHSRRAADVNEGGYESQVEFLAEGSGIEAVERQVDEWLRPGGEADQIPSAGPGPRDGYTDRAADLIRVAVVPTGPNHCRGRTSLAPSPGGTPVNRLTVRIAACVVVLLSVAATSPRWRCRAYWSRRGPAERTLDLDAVDDSTYPDLGGSRE